MQFVVVVLEILGVQLQLGQQVEQVGVVLEQQQIVFVVCEQKIVMYIDMVQVLDFSYVVGYYGWQFQQFVLECVQMLVDVIVYDWFIL